MLDSVISLGQLRVIDVSGVNVDMGFRILNNVKDVKRIFLLRFESFNDYEIYKEVVGRNLEFYTFNRDLVRGILKEQFC